VRDAGRREFVDFSSLIYLFASGQIPTVVTDSPVVADHFGRVGFPTAALEPERRSTATFEEAIVVSTNSATLPAPEKLQAVFANSAVLDIPLLSFECSPQAVAYLVERLRKLDFHSACIRSLQHVAMIESTSTPLLITSEGTELTVELGADVSIALPRLEPIVSKGQWVALAGFLEVGLVPNITDTSFSVNGELVCDGASVAYHGENHDTAGPSAKQAWDIVSSVRCGDGFPITICVKNSRVISIRTSDNVELLASLVPLAGKSSGDRLIEVAFASLPPSPHTNWTVNSQINEASGGVHLAIGTGTDGAHIDFIASYAEVS